MEEHFQIKTCPTCGSDKIQWVVKDIIRKYKQQTYTAPAVQFYECSNCGEKIYDKIAVRKIAEYSPAYRHEPSLSKA